jgi:hypothetical protein
MHAQKLDRHCFKFNERVAGIKEAFDAAMKAATGHNTDTRAKQASLAKMLPQQKSIAALQVRPAALSVCRVLARILFVRGGHLFPPWVLCTTSDV